MLSPNYFLFGMISTLVQYQCYYWRVCRQHNRVSKITHKASWKCIQSHTKKTLYLADLPYSGMSGFSSVLSINGIFTEEEIDFVIFWIVAFWYQVSTNKSRVCGDNAIEHVNIMSAEWFTFLRWMSCEFISQKSTLASNGKDTLIRYIIINIWQVFTFLLPKDT